MKDSRDDHGDSALMNQLTLYGCPKACSLVTHIALEMTGAPFTYHFIDLFKGEQRTDDYLALNPRGKVPLLRTARQCITENIAILHWLAAEFPQAGLLPAFNSDLHVKALSDLAWFASGIHPAMTRMLRPGLFLDEQEQQRALQENAIKTLSAELAIVDERLSDREWWFDDPTALDAYLFWIWARSGEGPIDLSAYSNYARHARGMIALPEVRRALDRERGYLPCFEQLGSPVMSANTGD